MRFVILGDLHYSLYNSPLLQRMCDEYYELLFETVLEQQADAVFAIGDTVDNGQPAEFENLHECARRTGLNFYTINGNHDLLQLTKAEISRWTGNPNPYYNLYFHPTEKLINSLNPETALAVVLDTPKEKSPKDHGGYLAPEQINWLKQQIAASADAPLFVFGHHPLRGQTRWSAFPMLNIDNSRDVKLAFLHKQEGPAFYFCGHNHANSITAFRNWHFVQTAAPLRTNDFRVVDFTDEQISLTTVSLPGERSRKLATTLMRAMGDFLQLPAKGFTDDRRLQVPLKTRTLTLI